MVEVSKGSAPVIVLCQSDDDEGIRPTARFLSMAPMCYELLATTADPPVWTMTEELTTVVWGDVLDYIVQSQEMLMRAHSLHSLLPQCDSAVDETITKAVRAHVGTHYDGFLLNLAGVGKQMLKSMSDTVAQPAFSELEKHASVELTETVQKQLCQVTNVQEAKQLVASWKTFTLADRTIKSLMQAATKEGDEKVRLGMTDKVKIEVDGFHVDSTLKLPTPTACLSYCTAFQALWGVLRPSETRLSLVGKAQKTLLDKGWVWMLPDAIRDHLVKESGIPLPDPPKAAAQA